MIIALWNIGTRTKLGDFAQLFRIFNKSVSRCAKSPDFVPTAIFRYYCLFILWNIGTCTKSGDFAQHPCYLRMNTSQSRIFVFMRFLFRCAKSPDFVPTATFRYYCLFILWNIGACTKSGDFAQHPSYLSKNTLQSGIASELLSGGFIFF
ncbi:hypothetical protein FLCH110379_06430 [Flavobacterium chungbukense]